MSRMSGGLGLPVDGPCCRAKSDTWDWCGLALKLQHLLTDTIHRAAGRIVAAWFWLSVSRSSFSRKGVAVSLRIGMEVKVIGLFLDLIKNQIIPYNVAADTASSVAGIVFFLVLVRLYLVYNRMAAMKVMLVGIALITIGIVLNLIGDIFSLSWVMQNIVTNFFDASGAVVSAIGITILVRKLFQLTSTDSLTGCCNRWFFKTTLDAEIARAKRNNSQLSLMFIDLNKFKMVNDQMGHPVGDSLLQKLAGELKSNVRVWDIVARWGGDEFVVLFPQTDYATASALSARIESIINGPGGGGALFAISVGLATYPQDGTNADTLISVADQRMYENKRGDQTVSIERLKPVP